MDPTRLTGHGLDRGRSQGPRHALAVEPPDPATVEGSEPERSAMAVAGSPWEAS
jgi:hypothetical protein